LTRCWAACAGQTYMDRRAEAVSGADSFNVALDTSFQWLDYRDARVVCCPAAPLASTACIYARLRPHLETCGRACIAPAPCVAMLQGRVSTVATPKRAESPLTGGL